MFLHFWFFTCCPHPFNFWTSLFIKSLTFQHIHTLIMLSHSNTLILESMFEYTRQKNFLKNHAHFKISSRDKVFTCLFFPFFIQGWNFVSAFLTGMSSSRDEISSRQKRVNSKRYLTINRDDFIPEWNFISAKTCKQ